MKFKEFKEYLKKFSDDYDMYGLLEYLYDHNGEYGLCCSDSERIEQNLNKLYEITGEFQLVDDEYWVDGTDTIMHRIVWYLPKFEFYCGHDVQCTSQSGALWDYVSLDDLIEFVPESVTKVEYFGVDDDE